MSKESLPEQVPPGAAAASEPEPEPAVSSPPTRAAHEPVFLLVLLCNAVTVGIGGLYGSTGSVLVVTVAAGLVALLGGLCLVAGRRSGP